MFETTNTNGNSRYAGRSRALVVNNADPKSRGRIRVNSPLLGETGWIPYLRLPFAFDPPEIGDIVYIECDGGFETHPVAWGKLTKLNDDGSPDIPEEFQRTFPSNRGFYTPGGHLIEFDDGSDTIIGTGKGIRITTSGGKKLHLVDDPTASSILIEDENANSIKIDSLLSVMDIALQSTTAQIDGISDKITVSAAFGDTLSVSATDGIQASTPTGTSLSMKNAEIIVDTNGTNITLNAQSFVVSDAVGNKIESGPSGVKVTEVAGAALNLSTGMVALGGSTAELLDLYDQTLDAFINNAASLVFTAVGPGALNPAVVTLLTNIKVLLTTIKGSL